jgi:hypothetical protein
VRYTLKKDRFSRSRGASQFLNLFCAKDNTHLVLYQKDGPGALKRLYLDRIFAPSPQSDWQNLGSITNVPNLACPKCGTLIGSPMLYRFENRLAIRLNAGTFSKVCSDGTYPLPNTTTQTTES